MKPDRRQRGTGPTESGAAPSAGGAFWSVDAASARAIVIRVKAVPGARADQIVGLLGDRLKVRVAAPPEDGRANDAICQLIARTLGVAVRSVTLISGHSSPLKSVRVEAAAGTIDPAALAGGSSRLGR